MDQDRNLLGTYLKERRARLDPQEFGFPPSRRRTPGLRREEVAQLAHVSATWYTWLEQGRGGAPSADVLDRLSRAFSLTEEEREHLYLLAQGRPPKIRHADSTTITPQLQRVLDAFADSVALVKTPDWTVLGWNRAATAVFADYSKIPLAKRNVLRLMFTAGGRERNEDWESVARAIVGSVRRDVVRTGMREETRALIDELSRTDSQFREIWASQDVQAHGEGVKRLRHPTAGVLVLEYSAFDVDGRPDQSMVVFNPATEADRIKVRALLATQTG